jgi:hypothetical protein
MLTISTTDSKPIKLLNIIKLSEEKLQMDDLEIEVEYQGSTIEKYGLDFNGKNFVLTCKANQLSGTRQMRHTARKAKNKPKRKSELYSGWWMLLIKKIEK